MISRKKNIAKQDFQSRKSTDLQSANMNESNDLESKIGFYGKVAKFPNNIKPSKAYSFLEKVKINQDKLWYILIQQQDTNLQMLKYNIKAGVHLNEFVLGLKEFYLEKWKNLNESSLKKISEMKIVGEDLFVTIKNIPTLTIEGKSLINIIAEDLVKILRDDSLDKN